MKKTRRKFIKQTGQLGVGLGLLGWSACGSGETSTTSGNNIPASNDSGMFFKISLAQWSLHRSLGRDDNKKVLDNLDFAAKAKNDFGIDAVEYVNAFFSDKAKDFKYLEKMRKRAEDNGVKSLLIMVDGERSLGAPDQAELKTAIENHFKWVDAAKFLGCHSIRVNAYGEGTEMEVKNAAINGLGTLASYAQTKGINIIVENHGSYSSNGLWLADVMRKIDKENCGTLPDFGNFCIKGSPQPGAECENMYDRYLGVEQMMSFAKAVSAKSHNFDANGNETSTDYEKMMKIVKDANYTGYVGIEYEGSELSEDDGIRATQKLLEKVGKKLS